MNKSFELVSGNGTVMFSAPHAVEQTRYGKIKFPEPESGPLVRKIQKLTNCPIIVKTFNNNDDANFDPVSDYKEELAKYIRENDIKYLFDIHQLAIRRIVNIDFGVGERYENVKPHLEIVEYVVKAFSDEGIDEVYVNDPFSATYPYTVSSYIARECGITCVEIEINSRLLRKDSPENCFDKIANILVKLTEDLNEKEENV